MKWDVSVAERPRDKGVNQDRHLVLTLAGGAMCTAVLDGHGKDNGAVDHVFKRLPELICTGVARAEAEQFLRSVFATLADETAGYKSGTTCSIALLYPDGQVETAVLGDSPIIARCDAKNLFISEEHNIISNDYEREQAEVRGGVCENGYLYAPMSRHGLRVARAFGNKELAQVLSREPSVGSFNITAGYFFFLCSDGFISLSDRNYPVLVLKCFERIEKGETAEKVIAWPAGTVRSKHPDDSTLIICRYS